MPFAALKGYYELVREQERVAQPQHQLTEEEARELSERLSALRKGELAQVTYYDTDSYVTTQGIVTRIDTVFRILRVVKTDIPFGSILRIEAEEASHGQGRQA
ncbi:MAG TPA: YolD-like family protein [Candidatus Aphodovivens excrementavium]|nr:YolD-like family protein [Candidatus Aphodovivens excrementavium]